MWPASTWIRWRIRLAQGQAIDIDPRRVNLFANISIVQAVLIIAMVFAATAMARGFGI